MSEIKTSATCDGCQKKTFDYMADGWIITEYFVKYKGRDGGGQAITETYIQGEHQFCSWECFREAPAKELK